MRTEPVSELVITESLAMNWEKTGAIVGVSGKYLGTIFRIHSDAKIYFGRDSDKADFVFYDDSISRVHCWISYDNQKNCYYVCDNSRNGTILNKTKKLNKNVVTVLHAGDELKLADTQQIFKLG